MEGYTTASGARDHSNIGVLVDTLEDRRLPGVADRRLQGVADVRVLDHLADRLEGSADVVDLLDERAIADSEVTVRSFGDRLAPVDLLEFSTVSADFAIFVPPLNGSLFRENIRANPAKVNR
ncbi:hypothetical protein GWG54_18120 [Natronococcus sp. JC468]|uniref:hypothetical protein n=1 Tax=Natronococcus sp. JC468 TaxID=1961921 RepID=UPI00143905A6|nr:hypothetical protein [Natronococcus sp. JC468]NKE37685.1 hypothetical protein [Natronococcus sp. JC468]